MLRLSTAGSSKQIATNGAIASMLLQFVLSIRLSVCHTRDVLLNGSRYWKYSKYASCTIYDRAMFIVSGDKISWSRVYWFTPNERLTADSRYLYGTDSACRRSLRYYAVQGHSRSLTGAGGGFEDCIGNNF